MFYFLYCWGGAVTFISSSHTNRSYSVVAKQRKRGYEIFDELYRRIKTRAKGRTTLGINLLREGVYNYSYIQSDAAR